MGQSCYSQPIGLYANAKNYFAIVLGFDYLVSRTFMRISIYYHHTLEEVEVHFIRPI